MEWEGTAYRFTRKVEEYEDECDQVPHAYARDAGLLDCNGTPIWEGW
jgi:hypothetical protein